LQVVEAVRNAARDGAAVANEATSRAHAAADIAFLSATTVLSLAFYVRGLGFYYDDYPLLSWIDLSEDRSLLGYYDHAEDTYGERPVAAFAFATVFRLFGLNPLGYHLANGAMLVAIALLLYFVLRELRLPRVVSVAIPLVYVTLPHYATARFWAELVAVNLSVALYLVSLYASLRALRATGYTRLGWVALVGITIAATVFTYEVVVPLFLFNALLVRWAARRDGQSVDRLVLAAIVGTLLIAGGLKAVIVADGRQNGYELGLESGVLHHLAYLASGVVKLNLGTYLLALPYVLWWIVDNRFSALDAGVAAAVGLIAFFYVRRLGHRDRHAFAAPATWRVLIVAGVITIALGYAIFLTSQSILFRSAGIDNRLNAGAALGVAGVLVGVIGLVAVRLDARRSVTAFSFAIALSAACGVFVINSLASFWTSAAEEQHAILSSIREDVGPLQPSTTIILDGSCPELGPAVVFAGEWDLMAALQLANQDWSLTADVASEDMHASRDGLTIVTVPVDDRFARTYRYGAGLIVYDYVARRAHRLPDRSAAARYVRQMRPSFDCPRQRSFAWGFDPWRRLSLL
jgi:hypothetical protein